MKVRKYSIGKEKYVDIRDYDPDHPNLMMSVNGAGVSYNDLLDRLLVAVEKDRARNEYNAEVARVASDTDWEDLP
jgi:hypothetical protein